MAAFDRPTENLPPQWILGFVVLLVVLEIGLLILAVRAAIRKPEMRPMTVRTLVSVALPSHPEDFRSFQDLSLRESPEESGTLWGENTAVTAEKILGLGEVWFVGDGKGADLARIVARLGELGIQSLMRRSPAWFHGHLEEGPAAIYRVPRKK